MDCGGWSCAMQHSVLSSTTVDAGLKRQQFRRLCSQKKTSHRRGRGTHSTAVLNLPAGKNLAPVRQPPVWSNGDATTASESSSHRNINLDSRYAVTPAASGAA